MVKHNNVVPNRHFHKDWQVRFAPPAQRPRGRAPSPFFCAGSVAERAWALSRALFGRFGGAGLSIWAGGVYQYSALYDECDAQGVLIYHDMMFIEQGHGPCCPYYAYASGWSCGDHAYNASCDCSTQAGADQRAEIVHQVRRLAHHAWGGKLGGPPPAEGEAEGETAARLEAMGTAPRLALFSCVAVPGAGEGGIGEAVRTADGTPLLNHRRPAW